jgi:DNA ligase-1
MSRAGNKFHAPIEFVKDVPKDIVLDGELFCGRNQFDIASGLVRLLGGTYEQWNGKVSYEVFDAPLVSGKFEDRMKTLKTVTSKMKHANIVVQERVQDASHVSTKLAR